MDNTLYTKPHFLQGGEELAWIETDRNQSNELHLEAGTEFVDDGYAPKVTWASLAFRYQMPGDSPWIERAVVDTDLPGMKTACAQLGAVPRLGAQR